MPVLIAAVVVVGVLCLLDLLLTFGVIRRLREHTAMLNATSVPDSPIIGVSVGESPDPFAGVTTAGDTVTRASVVAFFSTSCSICPERVPLFVDYLKKHRVPSDRVLAVVVGDPAVPAPYLPSLEGVAQVCTEPEGGELERAFKVVGFPAFALLDAQGEVTATEYNPVRLPEPALAPAVN
jgi:hypothetical protein